MFDYEEGEDDEEGDEDKEGESIIQKSVRAQKKGV